MQSQNVVEHLVSSNFGTRCKLSRRGYNDLSNCCCESKESSNYRGASHRLLAQAEIDSIFDSLIVFNSLAGSAEGQVGDRFFDSTSISTTGSGCGEGRSAATFFSVHQEWARSGGCYRPGLDEPLINQESQRVVGEDLLDMVPTCAKALSGIVNLNGAIGHNYFGLEKEYAVNSDHQSRPERSRQSDFHFGIIDNCHVEADYQNEKSNQEWHISFTSKYFPIFDTHKSIVAQILEVKGVSRG